MMKTIYAVVVLVYSYEDQSMSSDMHLNNLIDIWECKILDSDTDKLTRTVLHIAIYVARELLNQQALLLPHVSRIFLHAIPHQIVMNNSWKVGRVPLNFHHAGYLSS